MSIPGNPSAFWPLDDNAGNGSWRDVVGSHPLTGHNGPTAGSAAPGITLAAGSVALDGSSQYLSESSATLRPSALGFELACLVRFASNQGGAGNNAILGWWASGTALIYYYGGHFNFIINTAAGQVQVSSTNFTPLPIEDQWYPVQAWYDPAGTLGISICGITNTLSITHALIDGGEAFTVSQYGGGNYFLGSIEAAGVYPLLAPADRQAVLDALRNFDVGSANRLLNCGVNSLTSGYQSSNPPATSYPAVLSGLLGPGWDVVDNGIPGRTGEVAFTAILAEDYPPFSIRRPANIYVYWEGTNSLGGGDTPAQAYATTSAYIQWCRLLGYQVAVLTCLPVAGPTATTHPTLNALESEYNVLVKSNAAGADWVIDVASDPRLSDATNLTYFNSGGQHLTDAGYAVVAGLVYAVIAPPAASLFRRTLFDRAGSRGSM